MADYTTVADLKTYLRITSSGDDTLLAKFITRASAAIDAYCGRWFVPVTQTRKFNAAGSNITGRLLLLDADLLSVSSIINGDGTSISLSNVILRPVNWTPYFGIALRQSSGLKWNYLTDPEDAISVTGSWGYSTSIPEPIVQATLRLASWLYRQRDTGLDQGPIETTERGVAKPPASLPTDVSQLIGPYIRLRMSVFSGHGT